jgi:hypothetical protein
MMQQLIRYFLFTVSLFSAASLYAGIEVSPILIDLQGDDVKAQLEKQDVRVFNNGSAQEYVKITPYAVTYAGTDKQKLVAMNDPEKLGLLVSPRIMIVPPGQARNIRLVLLNEKIKTDHIFQVDIQPTAGKLILGPAKQEEMGIKVLVGYGLVIIQRPNQLNIQANIKRSGDKLTIKNIGNSNFLLVDGKQCDSKQANCKELPVKRLYAGQIFQTTLPYTTPVTYLMSYMQKSTKLTSN